MEISANAWESFLAQHESPHLLQTAAWGELKSEFGWQPVRVVQGEVGAQLLFRRVLGWSVAYLPRGPVGQDYASLWPAVDTACRKRRAIFLKVEPDQWEDEYTKTSPPHGFFLSPQTIQPPRTLIVDISGDEEQVLGQMKQKTRYNIKLAQKKGVVVRAFSNIEIFHELMQITSQRDVFGVHSVEYYRRAYEIFHNRCLSELLLAEYEGEPLAAVMVFCLGQRAWYFYGGSSNEHRDRMPNYLLQWEAIRWARSQGCTEYDLWGVPDADEATLEAHFSERSDGLWGVYRFKRGFGGVLRRTAGPWERIYHPVLYRFYLLMLRLRKTNQG